MALIRRPAFDQANRIGSLFLNPGGPGGSGIELVRTAPLPAFQVLSGFDVIGFDPRGLDLELFNRIEDAERFAFPRTGYFFDGVARSANAKKNLW